MVKHVPVEVLGAIQCPTHSNTSVAITRILTTHYRLTNCTKPKTTNTLWDTSATTEITLKTDADDILRLLVTYLTITKA